jgi:hypothetical protein
MTKFEQIGVNRQYDSASKYESDRNYNISCNICCSRGMHLNCDSCAISVAHSLTIATFNKGGECT